MAAFQLRNDSVSDILLADIGLPISASQSISFDTSDPYFQTIVYSDDLKDKINDSDIVLVFESSDLSISNANKFLSIQNQYQDDVEEAELLEKTCTVSSTPPSSPDDGKSWYRTTDGILYIWNNSKSKWLSSSRHVIQLEKANESYNAYLNRGNVSNSDVSGAVFPRDATLLSMIVKAASGNTDKECYLEKNYTNALTFDVVNYTYTNTSLNIDLDAGVVMQFFVSNVGSALNDVVCNLEFAWRYTS